MVEEINAANLQTISNFIYGTGVLVSGPLCHFIYIYFQLLIWLIKKRIFLSGFWIECTVNFTRLMIYLSIYYNQFLKYMTGLTGEFEMINKLGENKRCCIFILVKKIYRYIEYIKYHKRKKLKNIFKMKVEYIKLFKSWP